MNDAADFRSADSEEGLLGVVFGVAQTYEFSFAVTGEVQRNDYVQVHDASGMWMLARVDDFRLQTDLTSQGAREIARGGDVDYSEDEIAHAAVIGMADGSGGILQPGRPVLAGAKIFRASDDLISSVLGLGGDGGGALVGKLHGREIPVEIGIDAMVQKHISIVAKTGGGKSYLAGVLLEEMLSHGVTTLILDPHGEYGTLRENADGGDSRFRQVISEFAVDTEVNTSAEPLRFTCSNFTPSELLSLTTLRDNKGAMAALSVCIEKVKEKNQSYSLQDITAEMAENDSPAVIQLRKELEALSALNIFAEQGTRTDQITGEGRTTIVNFKGAPPEIQSLFVRRLLTALFELRKRKKIPPLLVVLEEAHNFCPQQGKTEASRIIRTIAAEGRKFGLGLLVITQRAAKVDKNVLSQCNTQFILRLTNGNDLKAVATSVEGITDEMLEEIPRLPTGVAVAVGGNLPVPLLVDVRRRVTRHGGESVEILWRK